MMFKFHGGLKCVTFALTRSSVSRAGLVLKNVTRPVYIFACICLFLYLYKYYHLPVCLTGHFVCLSVSHFHLPVDLAGLLSKPNVTEQYKLNMNRIKNRSSFGLK